MSTRPPRLLEWIAARLLPREDRGNVLGDLHEEYQEVEKRSGPVGARRWYRAQVIGAVPSALRRWVGPKGGAGARSNLRFAVRTLVRAPVRSAVLIGILSLGIGASTAVFSLTDQVLLRPLPYPESERLFSVWNVYPQWRGDDVLDAYWNQVTVSWPEFRDMRSSSSLEAASAYGFFEEMVMTLSGEPTSVTVGRASSDLFGLLGARAEIGRLFAPEEEGAGAPSVAVVTYDFWATRLGADPAAIGRSLELQGKSFEIVGVLAADFRLRGQSPFGAVGHQDLWIPIGSVDPVDDRGNRSFEVLARPRRGAALADVEAALGRVVWPDAGPDERRIRLASRHEEEVATARRPLEVLLVSALVLLLIVAANVTTVRIGNAVARRREWATRTALGAVRRHLLTQSLTESLVLAALGVLGGAFFARELVLALLALAPPELLLGVNVRLDARALSFASAWGLAIALTAGWLPMLRATRRVGAHLRVREDEGAPLHVQHALLAVQVALSMVLLCTAALFLRTVAEIRSVDPGFRPEDLATLRISPSPSSPAAEDPVAFYDRIVKRISALPSVTGVSTTNLAPFGPGLGSSSFGIRSRPVAGGKSPEGLRRSVRPGYFALMGIPVLEGRIFTPSDGSSGPPVAVVSESLARAFWPGASPLGDFIERDGRSFEVVGIVGDVARASLRVDPEPTFYLPMAQEPVRAVDLILGTDGWTDAIATEVHDVLRSEDPLLPIPPIEWMGARVRRSLLAERFASLVASVFGGTAALLVSLGLFGVALQATLRRRREIGVRVALGSTSGGAARHVLRGELSVVAVGIAVGLFLVVVEGRVVSGLLFGVTPRDPAALGLAALALLGVALASVWIPARRAAETDPARVLAEG